MEIKAALDQQGQSATTLASAQTVLGTSTRDVYVDIARLAGISRTVTPAMQEETNALIRLNAEFDSMRMAVDQGYAAIIRFAQGQDLAREAVASGIATEAEAAATLDLLAQKLGLVEGKLATGGAVLQGHATSSGAAAEASQNLAFQFNDVAMMAAAGQNPLTLAMQQGTQISQIFGQAGAAGAVGLLKQRFMAFLNPTTLVTVALVAGGAALLQGAASAFKTEGSADDAAKAIDQLKTILADFNRNADFSVTKLDELKKKYGEWAEEIRQTAQWMAQVNVGQAVDDLSQKTGLFSEKLRALAAAHRAASEFADQNLPAEGQFGQGQDTDKTVADRENYRLLREQVDQLAKGMGLTVDQALRLNSAFDAITGAKSMQDIHDRAADALKVLRDMFPAGEALPAAFGDAAEALQEVERQSAQGLITLAKLPPVASDLGGAVRTALSAMRALSGSAPGAGWLSSAISQADTLAAKLWNAVIAADAARTTNPDAPRLPGGVDALAADDISLSQGNVTRRVPVVATGSGGGGGGGGGGAVATSPIPAARPWATGGVPDGAPLSAYRNQVLNRPTLFPMAQGMGLMAEAGHEAIMPVGDGGVLAMIGGRETRLALARGPGGRLGVELPEWTGSMIDRAPIAFASGGLVQGGQSLPVGAYGGGGGRAPGDAPKVTVNVTTPAGHTAQVNDRMEGNTQFIDVVVEQIEGRLAGNVRSGHGAHVAALADAFGLQRRPR